MNTLSVPPLVMAGVVLFVGSSHLLIYLRQKEQRQHLTFALTCLTVGLYDLFAAGLYNSASPEQGVGWQRVQVVTLALACIAFGWFVYDYLVPTGAVPVRTKAVLTGLSLYFVLAAVTGLLDRSGLYRPLDQPLIKDVQFFGQPITYQEMEPGPLTDLQTIVGLAIFVFLLCIAVVVYRRGHRSEARPLLLAMSFFFASALSDALVSVGVYSFVYTMEFGYLAIVLLMTYALTSTVVEAAATRHALQESEERFRRLAENAPDVIYRWSVANGVEYVSPIVGPITGYSAEELLANSTLALSISTGHAPSMMAEYQWAIAQNTDIPVRQFSYTRKDGTPAYAEVRSSAIRDDEGRIVAFEGVMRDVTTQRQIEEAMRQANLIVENSPVMLFRWRAAEGWPVMLVSHNITQLGYNPEELLNGSLVYADLIHPEDLAKVTSDAAAHTAQGGDHFHQEYRLVARDGQVHWVDDHTAINRDAQGRVTYYDGIVMDITQRQNAEQALRESEERFRSLFENAVMGVYRTSPEGRWMMVNPALLRMLGYSSFEELVLQESAGHTARMAYPRSAFLEQIERAGQVVGLEAAWPRDDGSSLYVRENARVVRDQAGKTLYYEGTVEDISERKMAEAERERLLAAVTHRGTQLIAAAEISTSASTILDPEELMRQAVDLIRERFDLYYVGLFLVDEAGQEAVLRAGTGQAGQEMLAAGHHLAVGGPSMIGRAVATGQAVLSPDVTDQVVRFANPLLPETQSEMALPLKSRAECIGALTVQSARKAAFSSGDVTALETIANQLAVALTNARLYDQVQQYANRLEELVAERTAALAAVNKELEAFAYSVSHDLRAPLRSLDGFTQVLLEDYGGQLDATAQGYLHRVRTGSQRMNQLIDDLLQLSRLSQSEMSWRQVDLSALATEIAAELRQTRPDRQVEFLIGTNVIASGDARLLRVALANLLGNAWKFTGQQEQARIEFGCDQEDGARVYYVRDNGAGFDMAYADRLFTAFQRLHSAAEFEGTGVGLATVQRIVHRHHGHLWAKAAVGQGATFYFTLGTEPTNGLLSTS